MEATRQPPAQAAALAVHVLVVVSAGAAVAMLVAERPRPAGAALLAVAAAVGAGRALAFGGEHPRIRLIRAVSSFLAEVVPLGALAWMLVPANVSGGAGALVALSAAATAGYIASKAVGLGYEVRDVGAARSLRVLAVAAGLLAGRPAVGLWAAAAMALAEVAARSVEVGRQEEPAR